ncbi:MAG: sensor histidine kinase [Spirochaetia bacterium]
MIQDNNETDAASSLLGKLEKSRLKEAELREELDRTKLLLKEFRHRVNNNLQLLNSILQMKSAAAQNPEVQEIIESSMGRIQTIVHTQSILGQIDLMGQISLEHYLLSFLETIKENLAAPHRMTIHIPESETEVSSSDAVLLLLAVNELLMNAFEHAFSNGEKGDVKAALSVEKDGYTIVISDNGRGIDPDGTQKAAVGHDLVNTIISMELKGGWKIDSAGGTTHTISIPKNRRKQK